MKLTINPDFKLVLLSTITPGDGFRFNDDIYIRGYIGSDKLAFVDTTAQDSSACTHLTSGRIVTLSNRLEVEPVDIEAMVRTSR